MARRDGDLRQRLADTELEWRQQIKSSNRSKYLILFAILAIFSFLSSYDFSTRVFSFTPLVSNILPGVVAAILLSLVYDVFVKAQERALLKLERAEFFRRISREVILKEGIAGLTKDELHFYVAELTQDTRFVDAVASTTPGRRAYTTQVLRSLLYPLWSGAAADLHSWENRLTIYEYDQDKYVWKSRQQIMLAAEQPIFRVAFTNSAITQSNLVSSDLGFHGIIILEDLTDEIIESYANGTNQSVRVEYQVGGIQRSELLSPKRVDPSSVAWPATINHSEVPFIAIFDFALNSRGETISDVSVVWNCSTLLSFDDPCFYVQADTVCFVRDLLIDYSGIASKLSKVWTAGFLANSGSAITHDEYDKRITAHVLGGLTPGQGLAMTWVRKPN